MTNQHLAHIVAVLDRSGSMDDKVEDTCGGFNSFITEQRKLDGITTYVTLAQFDNRYEMPYQWLHIDDVPPLRLEPRGGTALYDAIGKTISATGRKLRHMPEEERPASVVFIIMTDGYENASTEFTKPQVKQMIERQQDEYSWMFQFFGADLTAMSTAQSLGINREHAMYYAGTNSGLAFNTATRSTMDFVMASASGASYDIATASAAFTDEDRDAAANPK